MPDDPQRILVLSYRHVGDALFGTPALRALRRRFPQAHITVIVGRQAEAILKENPHIDDLIVLPRTSFGEKWAIRGRLRAGRYDTGILFQHTFLNALFLCTLGCRRRVALDWKGCGPLLTHRAPWEPHRHEADRYLAVVGALGAPGDGGGLEMPVREPERAWAARFLAESGVGTGDRLVGLFPGSSPEWPIKRWPAERFAAVAEALAREHGVRILLVGGPSDAEVASRVVQAMVGPETKDRRPETRDQERHSGHPARGYSPALPVTSPESGPEHAGSSAVSGLSSPVSGLRRPVLVDAVGKTDLKQLAALLERCELVIANDTGPMHLATAVGARVLALVGPGDPRKTGPYGRGHRFIQKVAPASTKSWKRRKENPMEPITVAEVLRAAIEMLGAAPVEGA